MRNRLFATAVYKWENKSGDLPMLYRYGERPDLLLEAHKVGGIRPDLYIASYKCPAPVDR